MTHRASRPVRERQDVLLVDPDIRTGLVEGGHEARVIGTRMGEQHRSDIGQRAACGGQMLTQLTQVPGSPASTRMRPSV